MEVGLIGIVVDVLIALAGGRQTRIRDVKAWRQA